MTEHVTKSMRRKRERRANAHLRVRSRVRGTAERPRLAVYKSLKYIYAQVIDDHEGRTLVAATSADPEIKSRLTRSAATAEAAKLVGEAVAERAKAKGIDKVVFDRGGYIYHGNVKAVAEAAREKGLQF